MLHQDETRNALGPDLWLNVQANISMLFSELPFERRPDAAAAAGFAAIECWWPFDSANPTDSAIDRFVASIRDAGVRLGTLNFFAGDLPAGERGIASHPSRRQEFDDSVATALAIGSQLGVGAYNALYGNRLQGIDPDEQDDAAIDALTAAAVAVGGIGASVLLEPISGMASYPLRYAADAQSVIDRLRRQGGPDNVLLLADLYHLTVNGDDLDTIADQRVGVVGHVQIADAPGRHEPGTGQIDFTALVDRLADSGYTGAIGLEYSPNGDTVASLGWLRGRAPGFGPTSSGQIKDDAR